MINRLARELNMMFMILYAGHVFAARRRFIIFHGESLINPA